MLCAFCHTAAVRFEYLLHRAAGRLLQAVKDPTLPHQIANHNTGAWESWEVCSAGFVNLQWGHKVSLHFLHQTGVARRLLLMASRLMHCQA